jgi:D-3-phosphoglycerate dehydrogenase
MRHVVVAGKLHPSGRALLDAAEGVSVRYIEEISEPSYAEHIQGTQRRFSFALSR